MTFLILIGYVIIHRVCTYTIYIFTGFIVYVCLVAIVSLVMIFYYAPKIGQKNVLIYIIICSVVGSLSVMGCKAIGLAFVQTFQGISAVEIV